MPEPETTSPPLCVRDSERLSPSSIDPRIIEIGKAHPPERPYDNPRTVPVVNDARAYFERTDEQFDVVNSGLLDSHAVFSAMSSLRLDNYVYTVEAMRSAWRHVRTPGLMSVSFSIGDREWLSDRLYKIVRDATGVDPVIVPHAIQRGRFYIVTKGIEPRELAARPRLRTLPPPIPSGWSRRRTTGLFSISTREKSLSAISP